MTSDPIADRYAEALFALAKEHRDLDATWRQLQQLGQVIHEHPPLRQLLLNPDVEAVDKLRVVDRVLPGEFSPSAQAFLRLVLDMGRAESLPAIVEAFRDLVDGEQHRVRVLVRTARPLPSSLRTRLKSRLEHLGRRQVELTEETDPALLGGVQILFDRRIIDGSIQTQLAELRQQLKRVRV